MEGGGVEGRCKNPVLWPSPGREICPGSGPTWAESVPGGAECSGEMGNDERMGERRCRIGTGKVGHGTSGGVRGEDGRRRMVLYGLLGFLTSVF